MIDGKESALYMCNCDDCSSHIETSWHSPYCKYRVWVIEQSNLSAKKDTNPAPAESETTK